MNQYDYENSTNVGKNNKLLCTFSTKENLDLTLKNVKTKYDILYNKIFVLESPDTNEMIVTYNVDFNNVSTRTIFPQTISVHRKKETNTLYTINALSNYISTKTKERYYNVDWKLFQNSILLTQKGDFKILKTKINDIIHTN